MDFLKGELTDHFEVPFRYVVDTGGIIDANGQEVVKLEMGQYLWDKCVDMARTELQEAIGVLVAQALADELVS